MKTHLTAIMMIFLALSGLLILAMMMSIIIGNINRTGLPQVYTVPEVIQGRQSNGALWNGRTVLVQGFLVPVRQECAATLSLQLCRPAHWQELQPVIPPGVTPFPPRLSRLVLRGVGHAISYPNPSNPLLAFMSHLPIIRPYLPAPWPDAGDVYRVRLLALPKHVRTVNGGPPVDGVLI